MWVHPIVNDRQTKGNSYTLLKYFLNFIRMSMAFFDELLGYIKKKITKKNIRMSSSIPPEEKLVKPLT